MAGKANKQSDHPELMELLGSLCNGPLSDAEQDRLEALLLNDADARATYLSYLNLHASLQRYCFSQTPMSALDDEAFESEVSEGVAAEKALDFSAGQQGDAIAGQGEPSLVRTAASGRWDESMRRPLYVSLSVAACAVVVVLAVLAIMHRPERTARDIAGQEGDEPAAPQIAALVAGMADCEWAAGSPALESGNQVPLDKRFEMTSGLIKLVFGRRARCVLEGPAVFRVVSADSIRIESGRVAAEVPVSAVGFTVGTPWADVVDLGTEFGVGVDANGPMAVHVFKGKVQVKPLVEGLSPQTLTAGQAIQLEARGETLFVVESSPAVRTAFVRQLPVGPGGGYAENRFDEGREGWMVTFDGHSPPLHKTDDGPHGGYLETFDDAMGRKPAAGSSSRLVSATLVPVVGKVYFSFIAPHIFRGDHSAAYGKTLAYDLRISGGERVEDTLYCRLAGGDIEVAFPVATPPNDGTWTRCEVPLGPDPRWVRADLKDHPPATAEDLLAVLKDLRRVILPGEFYYGNERVGLDNVVLGESGAGNASAKETNP